MMLNYSWVVVSNIFYFHPYLGKIPILTNIFQRGWNHQLDRHAKNLNCQSTTPTFGRLSFACKGKPSKNFESSIWHIDLAANLGPGNLVEASCYETPRKTDTTLMVQPEIRGENMLRLVGLSIYPLIYKVLAPSQVVIAGILPSTVGSAILKSCFFYGCSVVPLGFSCQAKTNH